MGKLTGVSMGADVCYTNHARASQNELENLAVLLAAAGVNFIMGVPMGDDSMLSYQSSSFHDAPSLRQLLRSASAAGVRGVAGVDRAVGRRASHREGRRRVLLPGTVRRCPWTR